MKNNLYAIILTTLAIGASPVTKAQAPSDSLDTFNIQDTDNGSFLLPRPLPGGKYSHALSMFYVIVPKDWALDNIQAPLINYAAKYTLPYGFNLQASISTLFVSNRANFGPFWNHSFGNYHVGVGYQVAYLLGVLKEFGFNTVFSGWEQQPSLTLGYSFKKSAITLRGDMYYTASLYLSEGGNVISFPGGTNGGSVTGSLEQRLWKNRLMSFGVKVNHIRYHFIAWPAFPVNRYKYLVPEIQIGLKF